MPSTGGMGIIAFLVIGLGLMGVAITRYRRVRFDVYLNDKLSKGL